MLRFATLLIAFASPAFADPGGYGHMKDWGFGFGMMLGPIVWLIVLGFIFAGIIWFVRSLDHAVPVGQKSDAMSELDLRLARGEIDAEEYADRKRLLESRD